MWRAWTGCGAASRSWGRARAAIGATGEDGVFALAEAYRRFAQERPGLYAATLRAPDPDDEALWETAAEMLGVVRAVLAPYGLRGAAEAAPSVPGAASSTASCRWRSRAGSGSRSTSTGASGASCACLARVYAGRRAGGNSRGPTARWRR